MISTPQCQILHHIIYSVGVVFDSKLTWSSHVATVCKSMAYYLYLINYHSKSLPYEILKMLVDSLVFSRLTYALPVWGPAVHQNSLSRINRLHNIELSVLFVDCVSQIMSQDIAKLLVGFLYLC